MSFRDISLKNNYRTSEDDVVNDFLVPALKNSKIYKRAAGFFSSTALIKLSKGISGLITNNGKMQLVVSPHLSQEDINAIKTGYENKDKIIEKSLLQSLQEELNETDKDRLNLMIHLIEVGILDIKIAVLDFNDEIGMYHEKIGILQDEEGNKLAFTGSYNESLNSYVNNFESLDVYSTLNNEFNRVFEKEKDFDNLWNNETDKLQVKNFPDAVKEELFKVHYNKARVLSEEEIIIKEKKQVENKASMPDDFLRPYQNEAIQNWKQNNYIGIFDMATGTGKTLTALGASIQLLKDLNYNLGIVIICPYTHLVEQWAEDLENYTFNPIVGFGSSRNKRWKEQLQDTILKYKLGVKKYFCFITTNATYTSSFVQEQLHKVENKNILFIADEAHNLGAPNLMNNLNNNFRYRLALSATFERYNDEDGTEKLSKYFGNYYAIHYSLRQAIDNKMLTEYKYYPIVTYLDSEELDEYIYLTRKIGSCVRKEKSGKFYINTQGKKYLLQRARVVSGSMGKLNKVIELLKEQNKNNGEINNTLIYCGATTINDAIYNEETADLEDVKQVDYMRKNIKEKLNISVAKFTSTETQEERALIKEQFVSNEINAIVAIKCLDEGVNIPSINTAYILASSTNPREYVQRKGRVLRKAPNKIYAFIYDFITLPRSLDNAYSLPEEVLKEDLGLVKRELIRLDDFAKDALNYSDSLSVREKIIEVYGELLNKYGEGVVE